MAAPLFADALQRLSCRAAAGLNVATVSEPYV